MIFQYRQPRIQTCQGIQPENRKQGYSPSPSRQRHLKQQYVEASYLVMPILEDILNNNKLVLKTEKYSFMEHFEFVNAYSSQKLKCIVLCTQICLGEK